ncbi:polysaccharide deacetylase family protein [Streptomyces sp. NBC_00237]|uniref:polysaccharide deacetylase family protein n=1 Tax=Streptomyces sp. NBC_00237 TaxID=2975687 RepID=UPI0022586FFE|nr:polysaccharide deacetylase family protein [Streptomyces sp. NBC_00237]MCX5204598.1 polysaccharide deacetylase family protein [Streptomyces sp. NBC_00237]
MDENTHHTTGRAGTRTSGGITYLATYAVAGLALAGLAACAVDTVTHHGPPTQGKSAGASTTADPALPAPTVDMAMVRESEDPGRTVNLTLDDGPDPRWTPKALELLKRYGAKAVFCMTGPNAAAHPDLVKQVVAAGHRLCDHSVHHDTAMDKKPVAYQEKEILDAKRMIDEASGGEKIWFYRAPGGAFTPQSRQIAAAHGMRSLGWNVDPNDFARPGTEAIVSAVKAQLSSGPTVLLHDGGGNRSQTMDALERLLPWFEEQGYAFSFPKG